MSLQRIATVISSITAFLLVFMKIAIGLFSSSIAVLSSAIDSLLDLFVSVFNFVALKNSEKPSDETFNYGRGKIEPLASLIEGTIITLSGIYILYESIIKILFKTEVYYLRISIMVMFISFVITLGLVLFLDYVAKKTNNLVIQADALHYKMDLYTTGGILFSLVVIYYTSFYYIDAILGILIAFRIIFSSFGILKAGFLGILDVSLDANEVDQMKEIIQKEPMVRGYHLLRTRQSGDKKIVDCRMVFDSDILLSDAHKVSDRIEGEIQKIDQKSNRIFNIHLEPYESTSTKRISRKK